MPMLYPMFTVPADVLLKMVGLEPHEQLMEKGVSCLCDSLFYHALSDENDSPYKLVYMFRCVC